MNVNNNKILVQLIDKSMIKMCMRLLMDWFLLMTFRFCYVVDLLKINRFYI